MSDGTEATIFLAFMLVFSLIPSTLMVFFGWRKTRSIANPVKKLAIRSFIGSVAFTPSVYGHAGPLLAWWILTFGNGAERFWFSLVPVLVVWSISFGVGFLRLRMRPSTTIRHQRNPWRKN